MQTRTRMVSKAGAAFTAMSLVIALGIASPTLAQKGEAPPRPDEPKSSGVPPIISTPDDKLGDKTDGGLPPAPALADPPAPPAATTTLPLDPQPSLIDSAPPREATLRDTPLREAPAPAPAVPDTPARDASFLPAGTTPAPSAAAGDDPEKSAQEFMDKARQEADTAIKALNTEADSLRARLKKVEAGLKRWQSLQAALDEQSNQRTAKKTDWRQKDEPEVPTRRRVAGPAQDRDGHFPAVESAPTPRFRSARMEPEKKR